MPAEMAGMTNDAEMAGPLGSTLNDGRKSALRAPASRGLEVRVRPVRRRSWPDEDKLRMVRETLQPGAVVQAVADRQAPSSCWLLGKRVGTPRAMLARSSSRGSNTADVGPYLECVRPGGAVLAGGDVVAAEVEEVVDLVVGGEETLGLAG